MVDPKTKVPFPYGNPEGKYVPWTVAELIQRWPAIDWLSPQPVATLSDGAGLACRICVARHSLQGPNVKHLPQTLEAFEAHMREEHSLP